MIFPGPLHRQNGAVVHAAVAAPLHSQQIHAGAGLFQFSGRIPGGRRQLILVGLVTQTLLILGQIQFLELLGKFLVEEVFV